MALWCSIRTFAKHATELGNQQPAEPVFFVKPNNCIQTKGPIQVSSHPGSVHHEVECVIRLGQDLQIDAIAVGLDLTDRDTQLDLRKEQLPWSKGKCFRASAVLGNFAPWKGSFESLCEPSNGLQLHLTVNDEVRQSEFLSSMSITPAAQYDSLIGWAPVQTGDYLFTGTPSGV
ncbi:MAG TPA: fumarylacetoacetate hydrolase family protein, partial [Candidatus Thalassarchaeaceae archaeon]|nr:fumarylacetoacetate hydrolase family protein [Candidatus Thalassarchaeaceae archaeon]